MPWSWQCQSTLSREVLVLHIPGRHYGRVQARFYETANTPEDILDFLPHHTATAVATFIDNHSSLAVLVKSRSSSRKLNAVARKTAAILLCTLSRPLYAYTDTDRNPADAGSRRRLATSKSSDCTKSSSRRW